MKSSQTKTLKIVAAVLILLTISVICVVSYISQGIGDSAEGIVKGMHEFSKTLGAKEPKRIDSLHSRLGKQLPNEWLGVTQESGQTFAEYKNSDPNGTTKERNVIYMRPIGHFTSTEMEILKSTSNYLSEFYEISVEILDSIPTDKIPKTSIRTHLSNRQVSAKYILNELLSPNIPKNAAAYVAWTKLDLYNDPKKNFVFGLGNLKNRTGVYSLARFGSPEGGQSNYQKFLVRTLKLASHEVAHIFGVKHCIEYECLMNGSNSLSESDSKPVYLCPVDVKKICWNLDINAGYRFNELQSFWLDNGFKEHSDFYDTSLSLLNLHQ